MWNDASTLPFTIAVLGGVHAFWVGYMQLRIFIVFLNFRSYSPLILLHISKEAVGL